MDSLIDALRKVRRRLFVHQWFRLIVEALLVSAASCCTWLILSRCFPSLGDPLPVCAFFLVVGFAVGTGLAIHRCPEIADAAIQADSATDLKERLISSLELADADGPMVEALHHDAREHLSRLDIPKQFPFSASALMKWVFVPIVLFGLVYTFMPEIDLLDWRRKQAEIVAGKHAVKVKVRRLESVAKALAPEDAQKSGELADTVAGIERVAEDLRSGRINGKQAFARLTKVGRELDKERERLAAKNRVPQLARAGTKVGVLNRIANHLQDGRPAQALKKLRELREKLAGGSFTDEESKALKRQIEELSKAMGGRQSEMGEVISERLDDLGKALEMKDMNLAMKALEKMEMSLRDSASTLEQLEKMENAMNNLWETQQSLLGKSDQCRSCGKTLKSCPHGKSCKGHGPGHECFGVCPDCASSHCYGQGMRGRGRGRAGRVGDLPDSKVSYSPTTLPGPLTRGKALASILRRSAPEAGGEASVEFVPGAFVKVRQDAESALTKEVIPTGSKEFVRQYFGSLEPEALR